MSRDRALNFRVWINSHEAAVLGYAAGLLFVLCIYAGIRDYHTLGAVLATANAVLIAYSLKKGRRIDYTMQQLLQVLARSGFARFDAKSLASARTAELDVAIHSIEDDLQRKVANFREAAQRDGLTGLCNRMHFQQQVLKRLMVEGKIGRGAILFVDLDGFKAINDNLGHNVGDRLLQIAADRLRIVARLMDQNQGENPVYEQRTNIARFGGDEFVLYLNRPEDELECIRLATRALRVLAEPFEIDAHTVQVRASIGVALAPRDGDSLDGLLRAADTAMYHAKRAGRGRVVVYNPAMEDEARKLAEEEQEFRDALSSGELELHFQPLFELRTMEIAGAEALIRWRHPRRGLLLPNHFLHIVDRACLVSQLGEWVVGEGVRRIAELERAGTPVTISINISPRQLEQTDFVSVIRAALQKWIATPSLLQIEVTEDAALQDPETAARYLHQIADLGVSIAIDDFGTGYSNLASLVTLPISRLKIDKSLIDNITVRADSRLLVQTIITMADGLGFHTVAEGVESKEQLELLSDMGCDIIQGFVMSRAVELEQFRAQLLRKNLNANHHPGLTTAA